MQNISQSVPRLARRESGLHESNRDVPEEVPVAMSYNGTTHAVMMATPDDLEDFAVGFSLTEGIIGCISEIEDLNIEVFGKGIDIQMRLYGRAGRLRLVWDRFHRSGNTSIICDQGGWISAESRINCCCNGCLGWRTAIE